MNRETGAAKEGSPRYTMRASGPVLARLAAHLSLADIPDAAGARLVLIGVETPPHIPPSLVWFAFENDRGEKALIGMSRAGGDPWVFNGRTLKFCFRGPDAGHTGLHRAALTRLASRLDGAPFERFTLSVKERTGCVRADGPAEGQRSEDWAHPDQWREFCFFTGVELCPADTFLGNYAIENSSRSTVRYGDLECQSSHLTIGNVGQTPWAFALDLPSYAKSSGNMHYLAMIEDQDVIHGTGVQKVEGILDCLANGPSCPDLEFYNGCIPMMPGDDVQGPISRFKERTGREVVFSDMSPENCHHESLARSEASGAMGMRPFRLSCPIATTRTSTLPWAIEGCSPWRTARPTGRPARHAGCGASPRCSETR